MQPPVMVLGCGRSGTSIFGELFEGLASYRYYSEPPFAEVLSADFSVSLAFKVPRESEAFPPDRGLPFPLGELLAKAPAIKLFWIVRHPLDAVCSLRVGIGNDWGHHPRPSDWSEWVERPLLERCAHHWNYLNSVGFAHVAKVATVVRFEEMISNPSAFTSRICDEIGMKRKEHEIALRLWERRVQNTNNADFVEAKTSRPYSREDHTVRVGRWRENLSTEEVAMIAPIIRETGNFFGYELS